jgi:hypothetical protein
VQEKENKENIDLNFAPKVGTGQLTLALFYYVTKIHHTELISFGNM